MFSLTDLLEQGFTPDQIVESADSILSQDEIVRIVYNTLNDNDLEIPEDLEEHYNLHC